MVCFALGIKLYLVLCHKSCSMPSIISSRTVKNSTLRSAFFLSKNHGQSIDTHWTGSPCAEPVQELQIRWTSNSLFSPFWIRWSNPVIVICGLSRHASHTPVIRKCSVRPTRCHMRLPTWRCKITANETLRTVEMLIDVRPIGLIIVKPVSFGRR